MVTKKNIFILISVFLLGISIYFYYENLQLKSRNIELLNINKSKIEKLNELVTVKQIENYLGVSYNCTKEYGFDLNNKNFLLLEKYNNIFTNSSYIKSIYNNYIIDFSFKFSLNNSNLTLAKKILKGLNIGELLIDAEKVDLLVNLLDDILTKKSIIDLRHLFFGFNTITNSELNLFLNFINSKFNKEEIIRLETLTLDLPINYSYSGENIEKLEKLKVNTLELSVPLKDTVKFLMNSEYIEKVIYPDGINYNGKKAFYFIKRNGKIYIYDNAGNKLN